MFHFIDDWSENMETGLEIHAAGLDIESRFS
jgi:hypothetical protein